MAAECEVGRWEEVEGGAGGGINLSEVSNTSGVSFLLGRGRSIAQAEG